MIRIENILVATDFGDAAETALAYGRELAGRFGAKLHVLHVVQNVYLNAFDSANLMATAPTLQQDLEDALRKRLNELLIDSDGSGPPTRGSVVTGNSPALGIVDYAKDHHINLVILGTHGRGGLSHIVMGSVAERVVRLAPCPVLTVRHPEHEFVLPDALVAASRSRPSGTPGA